MTGLIVTRNAQLGESIEAWAPGFHVYGITVDNPSGWWLLIQPGNYYVPPFTFGWRQYLNGVTSVSVLCVQGPGALTSQNIGTGATVMLSEARIDNSTGYTTLGPGAITADLIAAGAVTASKIVVGATYDINVTSATTAITATDAVHATNADLATLATNATNAALAAAVTNVGATVIIDNTGITILNGFLTIADEFGGTVLGASGFAGSWADFTTLGLYNARFVYGVAGTVPNGRTAALPYWTAADVAGAPTLTFLGPGVKVTWTVDGTEKSITSDRFPVIPGGQYEWGHLYETSGTSTKRIRSYINWYTSAGVFISHTLFDDVTSATTAGLKNIQRAAEGAPTTAAYGELVITVRETSAHAVGYASLYHAAARLTPTAVYDLDVQDVLSVGVNAGVSNVATFYGDTNTTGSITVQGSVTFGSQGILLDGSVAATMKVLDGGAAVAIFAKSILLSTSYSDPAPPNAGIQFGADVNLSRRAADTLHTDDELEYKAGGRKLVKTTTQSFAHAAWTQVQTWTTTPWAPSASVTLQNNGLKVARAGAYLVIGVIEFPSRTDYSRLIVGIGVGANTTPSSPPSIDEVTHSPNTAGIARHVLGVWLAVLNADDVVGLFGNHTNTAAAAVSITSAMLSVIRISDG